MHRTAPAARATQQDAPVPAHSACACAVIFVFFIIFFFKPKHCEGPNRIQHYLVVWGTLGLFIASLFLALAMVGAGLPGAAGGATWNLICEWELPAPDACN